MMNKWKQRQKYKVLEKSKKLRKQFPVSSGQQHQGVVNKCVPVQPPPVPPKHQFHNATTSTGTSLLQGNPQYRQLPGHFTGSTGARVLSVAELSSGTQAYAKKNQFTSAKPVSGGMGMSLLQKMGWCPGEGLGKYKRGTLEPLMVEVRVDKRGLGAQEECAQYPKYARRGGANSNRGGIKSKKGSVGSNRGGINPNRGGVNPNRGGLNANRGGINSNRGGINPNRGGINPNRGGINPNRGGINPNRGGANHTSSTVNPNIDGTNKNPISKLTEYCVGQHYNLPNFELCHESGPGHEKSFLFMVRVNGVEYKPAAVSPSKKIAKAEAATVCLQALGIT